MVQTLEFDSELFQKSSRFYQEKDGKYHKKIATVKIISQICTKEEKISEITINLADYIGKGLVSDKLQMTDDVYFLEFEVLVEKNRTSGYK